MTGKERVLEYLLKNKHLTVRECEKKVGPTELRKIVSDLRRSGHKIEGVWENGFDREGNKTRYKRYFYMGGPNNA